MIHPPPNFFSAREAPFGPAPPLAGENLTFVVKRSTMHPQTPQSPSQLSPGSTDPLDEHVEFDDDHNDRLANPRS